MRAVFLDRDGVINQKAPEGDYVKSWAEFEFLPRVADAIRILNEKGFKVIVVTNQRGVALERMASEDVEDIHGMMSEELRKDGASIDAVYYCPHEKDSCDCRKPETGLLLMAKRDFPELSFVDSFVIGDSLTDMEAGSRLSCKCIFITDGPSKTVSYPKADSLYDAVTRLIDQKNT